MKNFLPLLLKQKCRKPLIISESECNLSAVKLHLNLVKILKNIVLDKNEYKEFMMKKI